MRVSELARELGKTNREILDVLARQGVEGKTHSSNVSEEEEAKIRGILGPSTGAGAAPAKSAAPQGGPPQRSEAAPARSAAPQGGPPQRSEAAPAKSAAPQGGPPPRRGTEAGAAPPAAGTSAPKRKLIAVYRPQNAENMKGTRPQGQNAPLRRDGLRPQSQRTLRPQGQPGPMARPQGARGPAGPGARPQGAQEARTQAGAGVRPQGTQGQPGPMARPQGAQGPAGPGAGAQEARSQAGTGARAQGPQSQPEQSARPQGMADAAARPRSSAPAPATGSAAEQTVRPQAAGPSAARQEARPQGAAAGSRDGRSPAGSESGREGSRDSRNQGGYGGTRDGGRDSRGTGGYGSSRDGNRDSRGPAGYGASRDAARSAGSYAGSRDSRSAGGYAGSRDSRGAGGYGANRDGSRDNRGAGGYAGSRDGRGPAGYGANRDGARSAGGYAGSRDGRSAGGYAGSRDSRGTGGYGANRDGGRDSRGMGGYGANRDGVRSAGGYAGSRDNRGAGGYAGSRDGRGPGARPGQKDGAGRSFDASAAARPQSGRTQKNAHKNDRYDNKRSMNEDGPRSRGRSSANKHPFIMPQKNPEERVEDSIKVITLPEKLTIKELAEKMKLQPSAIVKKLFMKGTVVTLNQEIDYEQAEEIAMEYEVLCEREEKEDVIGNLLREDEENEADMVPRPPVVCVMGHVDHGKTSLLDAIRQTNVTSHEAGGITQHIGAYVVEIRGQKITFLDTPGHEAFTAMRMRGAQSTDIAVLVVAADDGVMPQTVEAINHAKAAGVEIIVAVNKIDKAGANVEKVKQELTEYQLVPEDWGGSTVFVPVSARTGEGIQDLLEMILLTAEVKELKANPNRRARGVVIEAELDKGKGPVATVLVQKGTLRIGDNIAVGACYGKVRAMMDDRGRRVREATPSMPVEILGLNGVPGAGEIFVATASDREARSFAETFISEGKSKLIEETKAKLSLDDLFSQIQAGSVKEFPVIVKADVQGSVEAVTQSLSKLSNEEVVVKVIHGGVGAVNESDVTLASASNAIIIGFNVRPDATAKSVAEQEKVDIRLYRVIYQAIEDVEAAMKGMLDPIFEEQVIGHAVVRQIFKASGVGTIAGSYVTDGKIQRGCSVRVMREGNRIYEGALASLKRFKDDVREVAAGYECGLSIEKYNDIQEDDTIEAFAMVEVPR